MSVSESGISRVRRSTLLAKCLDCGHEFVGSAEYVVHTVDGQTVREVFNRVVAKCLISDSHRAQSPAARRLGDVEMASTL